MNTPTDPNIGDTPPTPPPPPAPPPATDEPASGHSDDRNLALLVHLSGIVLGFIVPLIVWLMGKDDANKRYLSDESKEALNFQITVLIGYVISMILTIILIGFLLAFLVWLFNLVFCILAAIKINSGGTYKYPMTLRLIK